MILVLTGAPGAGKGTQADLLSMKRGYEKLSTGDALRRQVQEGSETGLIAGKIMERGELVPDDVLFKIVQAELNRLRGKVVLLDGYPRNIPQADSLSGLKDHPVSAVIHLDVPREELVSRLSGRRVCGSCGATYHLTANPPKTVNDCDRCGGALMQRADDRPEAVGVRLDVYEKNTRPILEYYDKKGLYRMVSGVGSTDQIYQRLLEIIDGLKLGNK